MGDPRARELWQLLEPLHAVTYFSPEPLHLLRAGGYRGYWMGYFAGRAAPLGPVGPDLVRAVFYNFSAERVAGALPDAWSFAAPDVALTARVDGSSAALRRILTASSGCASIDPASIDLAALAPVADLAMRIALAAPVEGRPLFAANLAVPVPSDPVARLWHAATLLREHRGDGHVATLLSHGVGGREAHVLVSLSVGIPAQVYRMARDFTDEEWTSCLDGLRARGIVGDDGLLTVAGHDLVRTVEAGTDALAAAALTNVPAADVDTLVAALRPVTRAVVRSGEIPLDAPMGLDLRTVAE